MRKERYFGSVRFFKNMILLFVIVAITVPSILAIHFHNQLNALDVSAISDAEKDREDAEQTAEKDGKDEENHENKGQAQKPTTHTPGLYSEDAPAYQSLYPDFYAPEHGTDFVREEDMIYLTFDDGPSSVTDSILDTLKAKGVKATFFVIGKTDEADFQRMRRIVSEGHTLAMHSYSHNYAAIYASVEDYLADMYEIFCQIRDVTGVTPTLFRFPGGSINSYNVATSEALITEMLRRGFIPFDWNISSQDAASSQGASASEICGNVVDRAANVYRGVVLMHDTAAKRTTAEALPQMIDKLRAMGFSFSALTPEVQPVIYGYRNDLH